MTFQDKLIDLVTQGAQADAECLGRVSAVTVMGAQSLKDELSLYVAHFATDREVAYPLHIFIDFLLLKNEFFGRDSVALRHENSTLDDVLQLTDVAWPRVF